MIAVPEKMQAAALAAQKASSPSPKLKHYIPELDGLRGLAILMVLFYHYVSLAPRDSVALAFISNVTRSLWSGVDLFFVLSGFLITGILIDAKGSPSFFKTFYVRRTLRIFPLYFGVLAVVFLILPWLLPVVSAADQRLMDNRIWLWVYGTNIRIAQVGYWPFIGDRVWLHHLWSLAVEEHFYLFWPLVVFFSNAKTLRWVCLSFIVGALSLRVVMVVMQINPLACYVLTPCRLDALAIGGLLSLIVRGGVPLRVYLKKAIAALTFSSIILAGIFLRRGGLHADDAVVRSIGYSILAFWAASILMLSLSLPPVNLFRQVLRSQVIRGFGKYSYGIYIYHVLLLPSFEQVFSTKKLQQYVLSYVVSGILHLLLAVGASLAVAFISWHIYEKHFLKLKRFFEYERTSKAS